jgi:hypothetical protein
MQQNQIDNEEVTISIKTTMNVLKKGFAINIKYDYDTEYETDGDDESVKYETNNKIHICKNIFGDESYASIKR